MAVSNERPRTSYMGNPATDKRMGLVRFATAAEAAAGTSNNVVITPLTAQAATALDFAAPPVLGFGSTTPRPVNATTIAGTKVSVTTGVNASAGTSAAMTAGSVIVSTTAITANSLVFFTTNALGTITVPQAYRVSARTPGVSFTIQSSSATDTSTVDYWIIN